MSKVRVLVGTRKGAFILTADAKRKEWHKKKICIYIIKCQSLVLKRKENITNVIMKNVKQTVQRKSICDRLQLPSVLSG